MAEPPEFWAFLAANSVLFAAGGVLTGLSYRAYRRVRQSTLRLAAVGFAAVTAGGLLELVYQVGIRRTYWLGGRESLALQTIESLVIAAGLATLFVALARY